ncbi:hypothetical protein LNQ52_07500 [Klebsiella pneumoniae subsp. pneumoniae]|nr:hypothetical protein [Klebsiella pneumoniae subsp. pneumoniae]
MFTFDQWGVERLGKQLANRILPELERRQREVAQPRQLLLTA